MAPDRRVTLKSSAQIDKMAVAGELVARVLERMTSEVKPGVTTIALDSIDDEIVHGVPGPRKIRDGQIVSIDAGAIVDGWHGDAARTFIVGDVPDATRQLVETTERAMYAGIAAAQPGAFLGDISGAIEDLAHEAGYGVIR